MSVKTKAIGLAVASVLAVNAQADGDFQNKFYVGGGAGISMVDPQTEGTGATVDKDRSTAIKGFIGYDIAPNLAVEGYYADLGEAELKGTRSGESQMGYQVGGVSAVIYGYNPGGRQALKDREGLNLYGKVGFGMMENDPNALADDEWQRDNDTHIAIGAGAEYGLDNGIAVRGEFDSYDTDAKSATISVLKRFGGMAAPVVEAPVVIEPEPQPVYPVVAYVCDSDNDCVNDDMDACPRSAPGARVDADGCLFGGMLPAVNFETDSARLTKKAQFILNGVIQELQKYPEIVVEVQAHTDNTASNSYNMSLSDRRAASVVRYLTEGGIESHRMQPRGYGETRPAYRNDTEEGRYRNRRVEFEILDF